MKDIEKIEALQEEVKKIIHEWEEHSDVDESQTFIALSDVLLDILDYLKNK